MNNQLPRHLCAKPPTRRSVCQDAAKIS